ncbi:hypothetical protein [Planococcus faecalis]|uniref:hypothetical protein n=1 Tax=Planococcus faecalis TaxID=1598147 RepID=UPI0034E95536
MTGTIRSYEPEIRALATERLTTIANQVAKAFGAEADTAIEKGYDALWNHSEETQLAKRAMEGILGAEAVIETHQSCPVKTFATIHNIDRVLLFSRALN